MADNFLESLAKGLSKLFDEDQKETASKAALGPAAAAFKARQLEDAKKANLARNAMSASSATKPSTSTSITRTGGSAGRLTTSPSGGGNTSIIPRANTALAQPNTAIIESRARGPMRNVTPRPKAMPRVAGVGLAGPVGVLLSSATDANVGAEIRDDAKEMLEDGSISQEEYQRALDTGTQGDFRNLPKWIKGSSEKSAPESRESGGTQRSSSDRQMTPPIERETLSPAEFDDLIGKAERDAPVIPKATIVEEPKKTTDKSTAGSMSPESLFAVTHGGPFDPKSSMDKKKMAAIQSLLAQEGSDKLTPNQFALRIYRTT